MMVLLLLLLALVAWPMLLAGAVGLIALLAGVENGLGAAYRAHKMAEWRAQHPPDPLGTDYRKSDYYTKVRREAIDE